MMIAKSSSHALSSGKWASCSRTRTAVSVKAQRRVRDESVCGFNEFVAGIAAAVVLVSGTSMTIQPPAALAAEPAVVENPVSAYEKEVMVQEQRKMLEFLLQQQDNAKKAAIAAQRQQLQAELGKVEASLQARLNQQMANVVGAKQAGDEKVAEKASAYVSELQEKQEKIMKAAAQINSQLDRMELLEKARTAAAKQTLQKAASEVDSAINAKLNPWLETVIRSRQ